MILQDAVLGSTTLASSALPVVFKYELQNQEFQEGDSVTLQSELSKPGVPVVWKRGTRVIHSGGKYLIKQVGSNVELKITNLKPEDSGDYVCDCGDNTTTANIKVNGRTELSSEAISTMEIVFVLRSLCCFSNVLMLMGTSGVCCLVLCFELFLVRFVVSLSIVYNDSCGFPE